ncbi:MAG: glycosyltransferase family 4 protein [Candidatus Saccharimonadales bacterium]
MPGHDAKNLSIGLVFDDSLDSNDGVAQYVKTLGAWLSQRGHKVSYLVGETKLAEWAGGKVYSLSKNQTVSFNGNKLSIPLPGNGRRVREFMKHHRFDVLHVMVPYSPFMAEKAILAAPPTTAIVGTFHIFPSGNTSFWGSKLLRLTLRRSLRKFGQIVSVSQVAAGFAQSAYHISSYVIPNPVDISAFKPAKAFKKHPDEIVFLGRLVKRKGVAQLINAFQLLSQSNPNARLVIAGKGPLRQALESQVATLGLSSKVEFLGYIDEADKSRLLGKAAIACFPSLYGEAFGIVLIEAMASGAIAVLGGDNPGYRSVLVPQPKLLIDPRNAAVFAGRLKELLEDEALQKQVHEWQQQTVEQYDINVVGAQILGLYDSAIARLGKNDDNNRYG